MSFACGLRNHARRWAGTELGWLAQQIRPRLGWHLGSFAAISGASLLGLGTPLVLRWVIDRLIPERNFELLELAVALVFLCHTGRILLTNLAGYLTQSSAQTMGLALRVKLLRHLDSLSAEYFENTPVGAAMYPLKEPIEEISSFGSDLLPVALRIVVTTGMTLATMFALSPKLTLAVVPLIPVFVVARQYFRAKLVDVTNDSQSKRVLWSSFLEEHVASTISIQLLAQERRQERRAFVHLAHGVRSQLRVSQTAIWFSVCSSLAVAAALCATIGYGARGVSVGRLTLGSLVAFYSFVMQLFEPLTGASEIYARAQKAFASIRQVMAALAIAPSVVSPAGVVVHADRASSLRLGRASSPGGRIEFPEIVFSEVEFRYRGQKNLLWIPSLHLEPGECVALWGENGAGKSTLGKLIARLYDPTSGFIQLDGEDLRNFELRSLRRRIAYLAREAALFEGTLAWNLRFVQPGARGGELEQALESAGLLAKIRSLPDGLGHAIGPGGCQLSGGERQRLAIARALVQGPDVLILDEATSCLDVASEETVLQNIRQQLPGSILMVVTHRTSTLASCDRVLTLAHGRIVEDIIENQDARFLRPAPPSSVLSRGRTISGRSVSTT